MISQKQELYSFMDGGSTSIASYATKRKRQCKPFMSGITNNTYDEELYKENDKNK